MKEELLNKIFRHLAQNRESIKNNLLNGINFMIFSKKNKEGRVVVTIEYKENEE